MRERLRAVVSPPAPIGIDGPQRNMREDDDRCAAGQRFNVLLQPCQLLLAQLSKPTAAQSRATSLPQIEDIDQSDEVHAIIVEALPALAQSSTSKSLEI